MLPKELQNTIDTLPVETQMLFKAIVTYFEQKLAEKDVRIKQLEDQISKNSSNSSKPPSTDEFKKKPKSLRKKSGLKPGGQPKHEGSNLKMVDEPDKTILHPVNECTCCGKNLMHQLINKIERRQVYDIPPIKIEVTEHQSEIKTCSCGHTNKAFPIGVNHYVQYGPNIKGTLVYLQDYQLLPYDRTKELVKDLFGHSISTGTLYNIGKYAYEKLEPFEEQLKKLLTYCLVVGFDETGFRVMANRIWLHSYSTAKHAYYQIHPRRGQVAMNAIGILPNFKGIAVHDFWKSYYTYQCDHALCNAHLLRDLIFIKERFEQDWAQDLIDLLLKMKTAKQKAIAQGKSAFSLATIRKYKALYQAILKKGFTLNPFKPPPVKKRGRPKKSAPRNLLERLSNFADDILRFFTNFSVPFDNNFSERDLRMMKVKQKISGSFRSFTGAKYFARIRSYIMTARKQNVNAFDALANLFTDNTIANSLIRN